MGVDDEGEPIMREIFLDASPKQLGMSKNIEEMISLLKKSVHDSMEEIQSIRIDGNQYIRNGDDYYRAYKYNLQTDGYICSICDGREALQIDGGIGGDLCFSDEEEAKEVDGSDISKA